MKILVAVDGSIYSKRMLAYLATHDEWLGNVHDFTVVHVVAPVPPRAAAVLDKATLQEYYDDEAAKVLKPIRAFMDKRGINVKYVVKTGHASEVISTIAAKNKFDLLMMGSHGHTTLGNLVLGSVATKVMATCDVPVLLIR
ncbi:universal stress protein [Roseateles terrae]|uniref:Nucleotide-binding universal stress UspA family protein n=1 Tax=Roseateles terrae TaxID=431060 RepID=A0ABR6GS17_9BURK|nr:universal stress protein [Roseateles terrae]MBB3194914.1 nucleotide-binding universal stress UspA family protein [Roseateles terrae]OWQ85832.1 universal stress protein UspA [Roseateles terrae]